MKRIYPLVTLLSCFFWLFFVGCISRKTAGGDRLSPRQEVANEKWVYQQVKLLVPYLSDEVQVVRGDARSDLKIVYAAETLFDDNSSKLRDHSKKTLLPFATFMLNHPEVQVALVGFTDNTGQEELNRLLSAKRAQRLVDYLVQQGVPADRMRAVGEGPKQPIGNNNTVKGRALNRRMEFQLSVGRSPKR